jgi:hypothetical protein
MRMEVMAGICCSTLRRWAFNVFALASMAIGVVLVVTWTGVMAPWVQRPEISWRDGAMWLSASDGSLDWGMHTELKDNPAPDHGGLSILAMRNERVNWNWFGFRAFVAEMDGYSRNWHSVYEVTVPIWALLVITLMMPLAWTRRRLTQRRLSRRIERGLCAKCGYDLRASEKRCPECGLEFSRRFNTSDGNTLISPAPSDTSPDRAARRV